MTVKTSELSYNSRLFLLKFYSYPKKVEFFSSNVMLISLLILGTCFGAMPAAGGDHRPGIRLPSIRNPIPVAPAETSFYYDGSPLELVSRKSYEVKLTYAPQEEHRKLARLAATDDSKNVAAFSLTFFIKDATGRRVDSTYNLKPKVFPQSFSTRCCGYDHAIALLYEHNSHHKSNPDNVVKTMLDGRKTHVANQLHHSEQWGLIDLRDHVKDYIFAVLRKHPEIQKIYSICLNIYSTNNVCQWCGPTIEAVLPLLKADVMGFLAAGEIQKFESFKLFASVSSSKKYKDAYVPTSSSVGPLSLKSLDGKALYFTTPMRGVVVESLPMRLRADETATAALTAHAGTGSARFASSTPVSLAVAAIASADAGRLPETTSVKSRQAPAVEVPTIKNNLLKILKVMEKSGRLSLVAIPDQTIIKVRKSQDGYGDGSGPTHEEI